jgi:hypothetical protein
MSNIEGKGISILVGHMANVKMTGLYNVLYGIDLTSVQIRADYYTRLHFQVVVL